MSDLDAGAGDLRATVALLRALLERSSDMITVLDADGIVRYHYPPAVLGYYEGENFGREIADFVHPDDAPGVFERLLAVLDHPGPAPIFECRVRRADGTWRALEVTPTNLLDDPIITGIVLNSRDITERKRAQEAERHTEQRLRALIENSTDMMMLIDGAATISFASPATERVLGHSPGSLIGTNGLDIVHPDDLPLAVERLAEAVEGDGITRPVELRIAHAEGGWRRFELIGNNLLEHPDVQAIVLNFRDVTERRAANEILRASEERFRALVQHGYDIIAVVDVDARVTYLSPSVRGRLGYEPEEMIGKVGFEWIHPDDLPLAGAAFENAVSAPATHAPVEMRARHADGTWLTLEAVYTNMIDNPAVNGIVVNSRDVTERRRVEDQLAHQALHDPLTGLPNRLLLVDRLEQAISRAARTGHLVGVAFLDLDRFKLVNDTFGHRVGDHLLVETAQRLLRRVRSSDTVARLGGDEFVILGEDLRDAGEITRLGDHVADALAEPFVLEGREVFVTASTGVVVGDVGASSDALLRDADAAMYRAKERGGARLEVFDEALRRRAEERVATESGLRHAIERDELRLLFQPVVSLPGGRMTGAEALIRWHHPVRGIVGPVDFVPHAEESGQIREIGRWVLEEACRCARRWHEIMPMHVSINCSPHQLRAPDFGRIVRECVTNADLDPTYITLEMTEGVLMDGGHESLSALRDLKQLGVRLAIDDFGTRYASLGYLTRFPIDSIKIDRSFVASLGTEESGSAIVSAIVAMASALGLSVVAEGVETAEQAHIVHQLGCQFAQGFHFARPMTAEHLGAVLRDHCSSIR